MKKKILIIVPILIVALIVIIAIPKHDNIEATPKEVSETSEVSEPTQEPEITPEPEKEKTPEPQPEVTEPTNPEPVETVEDLEDGINSTHTDIELGDDEYQGDTGADALRAELDKLSPEEKAEIDAALERAMKEHPEWFTDDSSGTSPAPYQGPAVGTPSTGELPTFEFGQGDYSGLEGGQVY
ncbi:MAG: hypothetical protein HFI53_14380 [Lachnospiraceae bacterium]|nr:hypothetical protein [Lachnospiraceae bacterium]